MPKLSKANASAAKKAAAENPFALLPDGYYKAKLVEVKGGKSSKGDHMWTWLFKVEKKDLREYTVIKDTMMWKLGQIFEAFGVSADTDTEELVGKTITVEVGSEMFDGKKGPREVNRIVGYPDQGVELGPHSTDPTDKDDATMADVSGAEAADEDEDPGF